MIRIITGDTLTTLKTLPDESVHCAVTSPPYWGLRDYGVEGQLGLETSLGEYIETMVAVFREVKRVLRDDGTLWLNMGDCYVSSPPGNKLEKYKNNNENKGNEGLKYKWSGGGTEHVYQRRAEMQGGEESREAIWGNKLNQGLKPKDMCGIPWRVAFALQADGWWLRQDIIWSKPNPMPESVTDRCTKAHEYIFLLSKSARYYYDAEAISEDCTKIGTLGHLTPGKGSYQNIQHTPSRSGNKERKDATERGCPASGVDGSIPWEGLTRNKRSVWEIATAPFSEAHFATFPPELVKACILAGCPIGGVVLDPFSGAGTTGLVADRLKRDAIMIELNPAYVDIAERRIRNDSPLFASVSVA